MELETAVRLECNLVRLVWIDGFYDMVGIQEMVKYGRLSGGALGPVDVIRFAEAFGAKGLSIERRDQISSTFKKALETHGPVIVSVVVDYRDNHRLMELLHAGVLEQSLQRTFTGSMTLRAKSSFLSEPVEGNSSTRPSVRQG